MTDFPFSPVSETATDISERLRKEAFDAVDWNGDTMKSWDEIRALAAKRDGSDLPRLMFESLIENLAELMVEGANEIDRLRLAQRPAVLHRADLIKEVSEIIAAGVADDLASDEIADNVLLSIDLIQRGALSDTSTDRPMERPKVYDSQGREVYQSAPTSTDRGGE